MNGFAAHHGVPVAAYDTTMSKKQANQKALLIAYDEAQEPPEAPDIPRLWKFYPYQYIAIPLLLLIPLLALLGVLGESSATVEAENGGLVLRVLYTNRAHYEAYNHLEVTVRNGSAGQVSGAFVEFDRDLLDHFSQLSVNPSLTEITESVYRVALGDLEAGAERVITLDYQSDMNGSHDSWVRLVADGFEPVQADISMFVFP